MLTALRCEPGLALGSELLTTQPLRLPIRDRVSHSVPEAEAPDFTSNESEPHSGPCCLMAAASALRPVQPFTEVVDREGNPWLEELRRLEAGLPHGGNTAGELDGQDGSVVRAEFHLINSNNYWADAV